MFDDMKKGIIKRYNERLKKYGHDPRTLGWFKGRQTIRFKVITEIGAMNSSSILDVGCGFGDLYDFLIKKYRGIKYVGYDINPSLIKIAKEKHPNVCFEVKDILQEKVKEKFDYVVSSGLFEFRFPDSVSFTRNMLQRMFELCKKGVSADFMSTYVDFENKDAYYAKPEEIFSFCKTLSKRVSLRHDYMPFEFCVYIYKNDGINERNVFTHFNLQLRNRKTANYF